MIVSSGSLSLLNSCQSSGSNRKSKLIGASFTISHAMWLNGKFFGGPYGNGEAVGPPWQESLREIANSGVSTIRLSMPWDLVEPEQGTFNWRELDEALTICEQAGVEVVMCFGVKTPRHPEYHPPAWIKAEVETRVALKPPKGKKRHPDLPQVPFASDSVLAATPKAREAINRYIAEGIKRYRDRKSIIAWQVENEPLTFTTPLALSQVSKEVDLARSLDPNKRPILVTTWTAVDVIPSLSQFWGKAVEQIFPLGDIIGFDCYVSGREWQAIEGHWLLIDQWMDEARKQGKKVLIAEWQSEPWWKKDERMDFKNPNGNPSFNPTRYLETFPRAIALKPEKIFLWGLEFQIACKKQGNDAWWKATQAIIAEH